MIAEAKILRKVSLRDVRGELNLSQRELARLAGVHWQVIGKIERDEGSIRITTAYAILKALNKQRAIEKLPPLTRQRLTWKIEGEEKKEPKEEEKKEPGEE